MGISGESCASETTARRLPNKTSAAFSRILSGDFASKPLPQTVDFISGNRSASACRYMESGGIFCSSGLPPCRSSIGRGTSPSRSGFGFRAAICRVRPGSMKRTLLACSLAVVDLPQSFGPSIGTAPRVYSFLRRRESTTRFLIWPKFVSSFGQNLFPHLAGLGCLFWLKSPSEHGMQAFPYSAGFSFVREDACAASGVLPGGPTPERKGAEAALRGIRVGREARHREDGSMFSSGLKTA